MLKDNQPLKVPSANAVTSLLKKQKLVRDI